MTNTPATRLFLLLGLTLALCSIGARAQSQAVMLQYHHVSTDTPPVTSLSVQAFSMHMDYLEENNFTILPLEKVLAALKEGAILPDRTAVITFDDGYTSVYEAAFPLLQERDWPFTIFVTSGLVGSNNRLYSTWEQIREMASAGATIANHTVNHPYLLDRTAGDNDRQWLETVRREIVDAENAIVEETGQNHQLLAYPYGEYNPAIQQLVRELGFSGIAQHSGPINGSSDFTALPRFPFSGIYASMNTFPTKVNSLAFTVDAVEPNNPVTIEPSPGVILDFAEGQPGLGQLSCFNNNERITVTALNQQEGVYEVKTDVDNHSRRFRYNCTAPGNEGRYYWYSVPWVNPSVSE